MGILIDIFCITALITGLLTIKKTYSLWPMHIFLIASEITNLAFIFFPSENEVHFIYANFIIIEGAAFVFIFKDMIKLKQFLFLVLLGFIVLLIIKLKILPSNTGINTFLRVSPSLIIIIGCIFYVTNLFRNPYSAKLTKSPYFWILAGASLHFLLNFPAIFFASNLGSIYPRLSAITSVIIEFSYIILYIFLTKAFLCRNSN